MKNFIFSLTILTFLFGCTTQPGTKTTKAFSDGEVDQISKTVLQDKIKGGWAGQGIGCTYGGPTEFQWNGTMIGDHVPIPWDDTRMMW